MALDQCLDEAFLSVVRNIVLLTNLCIKFTQLFTSSLASVHIGKVDVGHPVLK